MIIKGKFYYPKNCFTVKVQDNNTVIAYPANSRCCSREISDVLRKPNVHYGIHKSCPLVPILGLIMQLLLSKHNFVNLIYSNSILLSLSPVFYSERFVHSSSHPSAKHRPPVPPAGFHRCKNTWRTVKVVKVLVIKFSYAY